MTGLKTKAKEITKGMVEGEDLSKAVLGVARGSDRAKQMLAPRSGNEADRKMSKMNSKRGIKMEDLDLSNMHTEDQVEELLKRLRAKGLDVERLLYAAFDIAYLDKLLKTGSYSRDVGLVYCSSYRELTTFDSSEENAMRYADYYDKPGFVVYNPKFLIHSMEKGGFYCYEMTSTATPENLIEAVYRIRW